LSILSRMNPGTRLGPYEILAPIGAGGMGEVYRARDPRLARDVAIKVLPAEVSKDPLALARFEREAKAVAALSHPNILAIFDVGSEDGVSYVVTELLEGETLRARLHHGAIAWRKTAEIGAALAEGLAAAHSKGITHRDLKPENMFLTSDGRVKILDFGLARFQPTESSDDETATQTLAGTIMGTIGYMSPEQVRGTPAGPRSDIFSLGCVLYE
jgi:serine/threonine protein kinase